MGYLLVFLFSFTEGLAVIGMVVPGTTAVATAGSAAEAGKIGYWGIIAAAIIGAFGGDAISFTMGRQLHRWQRVNRWLANHQQAADQAKATIEKWGIIGLVIGRFFAPTRSLVPLLAGAGDMSVVKFAFGTMLAAVSWAFVAIGLGKEGAKYLESISPTWAVFLIGVGATALAGWALWRRQKRRHA